MRFGDIRRRIFFGGSQLTVKLLQALSGTPHEAIVFTSPRQLKDIVTDTGLTLRDCFRRDRVKYFCVSDINKSPDLKRYVNDKTLGIGIGEVWRFSPSIIHMFRGRLLDFMGIPLPQFRGGAHYTWQILMRNRSGACNLQEINEDTVPAKFDSGRIIKSKTYRFPATVRTPQDYFDYAGRKEISFLLEFLREVRAGKIFRPRQLDETENMLMPRLKTLQQGWIDWRWSSDEIDRFICAFSSPYPGASTFYNGHRVFLKKSCWQRGYNHFHPFQTGLVFRKTRDELWVAARGGAVRIGAVRDNSGRDIFAKVFPGNRFWTPVSFLDKVMEFKAEYDQYAKR